MIGGKYALDRLIDADDVAERYEATLVGAEGFVRPVTIELVRPVPSSEPAFAERFVARANALAGVRHPNLARVLDVGRDDDGRLFVATERLDGVSLDAMLAKGALSTSLALHIATEVLEGLAPAHDAGIAHGDLRPSSVAIGRSGNVVVTGLVRGADSDARGDVVATGSMLATMLSDRGRRDARLRPLLDRLTRDAPAARDAIRDVVASDLYPPAGRELLANVVEDRLGRPNLRRKRAARRQFRLLIGIAIVVAAAISAAVAWSISHSPSDNSPPADADTRIVDRGSLTFTAYDILEKGLAKAAPRCGTLANSQGAAYQMEYKLRATVDAEGALAALTFEPRNVFTDCLAEALRAVAFPRSISGTELSRVYSP